jgi:hypothetical protein
MDIPGVQIEIETGEDDAAPASTEMMDDGELQSVLRAEFDDARDYHTNQLGNERQKAGDYYLGAKFGNEQEGRSSVVSTEVADTIEYVMPSLMRIFASTDEAVRFMPRGPEDVEAAEQASEYVNWVLNNENAGFTILHNWFKDALLNKMGVVKFWWDEKVETSTEEYEGLSDPEFALLVSDQAVEVVEHEQKVLQAAVVDPMSGVMVSPQIVSHEVTVRRRRKYGCIKVDNVPPEEFFANKRARSLEDARFVAHRVEMTASDLIAMGYDRDLVESKAGATSDLETDAERSRRFSDLAKNDPADDSQRTVLVTECYVRVDYDGDGIAELRRIVCFGEDMEVAANDPFDHIPFAVVSPILMPHKLVGRSLAELVMDLQLIKSTVLRQLLDNLYLSNNSRVVVVDGQVNLDDLLTNRPGGIVRSAAPGMVSPLSVPQIGQQAFGMLEYLDAVREQRTGINRASMGLDADKLQSTTAIAVQAQMSASQGKIEMIARVFAETGMRALFKGLLHLATKYENRPKIIRLRGKFVPMDPRNWKTEYDVSVNVGLGTGQVQERMQALMMVLGKQEQLLQQLGLQNPVVSPNQYLNTLKQLVQLAGFKDSGQFFAPQIDMQAMAQQQGEKPPSPAELEMAKVQAKVQADQAKAANDIKMAQAKLAAEIKLREAELAAEMALKERELYMNPRASTNIARPS